MPITINQNKVKFKHPTQQGFIEFNSIAEKTTEQLKEELRETATEISASWPQNAQDLTNKVNQLVKFQNTAPAASSATQIWVDTSNNTEQVGIPTLEDIATIFDKNTTYKDGQCVWYDTHLYKFIADHAVGSWTGTDAIQIVLSNDLGSQINDLKNAMGVEQSMISTTESEPYVGYWGKNQNGTVSRGNSARCRTLENPIDISSLSPGTKVSVLSSVNGNLGVFITDTDKNLLDSVDKNNAVEKGYNTGTYALQLVTLTVPQNAKYIMSSIWDTAYTGMSNFDVTVYKDSFIDLRSRINDVQKEDAKTRNFIAPVFSTSSTYNAGDYVWYEGQLYKFTAGHAAGTWVGTDAKTDEIGKYVTHFSNVIDYTIHVPESAVKDGEVNGSNGNTGTGSDYKHCEYIPIPEKSMLTISTILNGGRGVAFYTTDKTYISGISGNSEGYIGKGSPQTISIVSPANAAYIQFTQRTIYYTDISQFDILVSLDVHVVDQNFTDLRDSIATNAETLQAGIDQNTTDILQIKESAVTYEYSNLVSDVADDYQMNVNNGGLQVNTSYHATENYIPLFAGKPIAIMSCRHFVLYDINKTYKSVDVTNRMTTGYTFVPESDGYIRFATNKQHGLMAVYSNVIPTVYTPYSKTILPEYRNSDEEINRIGLQLGFAEKRLTISIDGSSITVTENRFGNGILKHLCSYGTRTNNLFEYDKTVYVVNGVTVVEKIESDDITPVRVDGLGTVGANHGYTNSFYVPANGQTLADVGSTWTDGTTTYLMARYDGTNCWFIMGYTVTDGMVAKNAYVAPVASLTPVSGAVHTSSIPVSGITTENLYPSVNRHSLKFYADGNEVSDGTIGADRFVVDERYSIMSYKGIWDYLTAHVGTGMTDDVPTMLDFAIRYDFAGNGICNVTTTIVAGEKLKLDQCGFLQAIIIDPPSGGKIIRRLNGIGTVGDYNWQTGVDMTSWAASVTYKQNALIDQNIPCNRVTDWAMNSNDEPIMGFTIGYYPDTTDGSDVKRIVNTPTYLLNLRDTKKIYPNALYGQTMVAGDHYTIGGYRAYIPANGDVTCQVVGEYAGGCYIVFMANATGRYFVPVPVKYEGYAVTAFETEGTISLKSGFVSGGVFVDVTGFGTAVFKIG